MGRIRRSMGAILLSGVFIYPAGMAGGSAMAAAPGKHTAPDGVPAEPSILEIQRGLAAGRFDVPALERHYAGRINSIDVMRGAVTESAA